MCDSTVRSRLLLGVQLLYMDTFLHAESASFSRGSIACMWSQRQRSESVWDLLSNDMKCFLPQTLFQRCEKLRPLLFRLASETADDDEALGKSQLCPWISIPK